MRAVENADGVSGLEAECEIDLHFYNSCTTGEKRLYSYYRHRGRAHKMGQFLNNKEPLMVLNKLISCLYEISIAVVFEVNVFMIKIIKLKIIKIRSENNKYF